MAFTQLISFTSSRPDEIKALFEDWGAVVREFETATSSVMYEDRDDGSYVAIVQFPDYETAMRNSQDERTSAMAERFAKLCDTGPAFRNLDEKFSLL
jgi:hypothetical protein